MKKYPALAVVEFSSIPSGMVAADVMGKESPISLMKCGTISQGRYLILIGGSTASVDMALEEARHVCAQDITDQVFLPDIDAPLHDAILGKRGKPERDALLVLETDHVPIHVRAAERILKGTPLTVLEVRLADSVLNGKALSLYQGVLHDVEEARDIAEQHLSASGRCAHSIRILTWPHKAFLHQIAGTTCFHEAQGMELDGEYEQGDQPCV